MSTPCKAFTDVLRACREEINAQFVLMRREFPSLETEPYFAFLRESGDAVVAAVDAVNPSATVETARAVCEVALELVARNLAGPKARDQWMSAVWQSVLVKAAYLIAMDPRHVIGALSNAAHLLSSTNGTRPAQWITLMQNVASLSADASEFLRAGQVAAWRSGMAHFREGALSIAAGLPSPLALASLDAAGETESLFARLKEDAWFDPRATRGDAGLVAQAGAFRGFGGLFLVPPVVTLLNGQWVASSGEDHWLITADAFGATFHRMAGQTIPRPQKPARIPVSVPPEFGEVTSVAENGTTTAVTATLTHAVLFFHTNG